MKKIGLLLAALFFGLVVYSQKYAYVDTEYILANIPEYSDAQDILDELAVKWQREIEEKFSEVDKLYRDYQAEAVLLPEDMKQQRENEIIQKEKEAKDLQKKRFGRDGDLFVKRQELIQPIQEKVYNAIETVSEVSNYAIVFDKAGSLSILYSKPKYDISDDILDEVSSVMQTVRREDRSKPTQTVSRSGGDRDNTQGVNKMINKLKDK